MPTVRATLSNSNYETEVQPNLFSSARQRGTDMNEALRSQIIEALDRNRRRAKYGAVAFMVGGAAQSVMRGLPRSPLNSWVVRGGNGVPTGYEPGNMK